MNTLKIILAVAAISLASPARAGDQTMGVALVYSSTFTCNAVSVSSTGASVGVSSLTATTNSYRNIILQDLGSQNIFWGDNVNLSTDVTSGLVGQEIFPAAAGNPSTLIPIVPGEVIYAVGGGVGTNAAVKANVCKGR